jgi:large subunit ribosomal protein L4
MPKVEIKKEKEKATKMSVKMSLPENIFGIEIKNEVLHSSVVNYLANQRQGTHATKTKGLVSGGGKKPWKQKHTGRARAGSMRSPLFRSGGTIFGPQPRDYSYSLSKKFKRLALKTALSAKLAGGEITLVDSFAIDKPKTKNMISIIKGLGLEGNSILIVLPADNKAVKLSARNIPGIDVMRASDLNAYTVMAHKNLLITKETVEKIKEVLASREVEPAA